MGGQTVEIECCEECWGEGVGPDGNLCPDCDGWGEVLWPATASGGRLIVEGAACEL